MWRDLAIVVLLLSAACGWREPGAGAGAAEPAEAVGVAGCEAAGGYATSSGITPPELQRTRAANLYEAIRRVRPDYEVTLITGMVAPDGGIELIYGS